MPSRAGITTGHPLTTWELLTKADQKTAGHELDELTLPQQRFPVTALASIFPGSGEISDPIVVVVAGALADHHNRFPSIDLVSLTLGLPVQHTFGGPRGPVSLRQGTFLLLPVRR
jgi:hypothetical protein